MAELADLAAAGLMLIGAIMLLLAAVALLRMPDIYTRLSASSKAVALGATSIFIAVAIQLPETGVKTRAFAGLLFFLLTAPIAAHALARAAARVGRPAWDGTVVSELDEVRPEATPGESPDQDVELP